ncbi:MAG: pyruvate dehydrogenase complex dihydrolipoamide acetyltransferase [Alphaproteobacteria bacterium CG11_big_fil_rev_8_21_14_0_20_44_7]|nr:MAG: pyruvate dehydrogenase complex dihydrolipoamide acetyltransferase [Alphaproteobacteria bacterium CG11_big_fil_rev_8_21_14_0_20_44_7]
MPIEILMPALSPTMTEGNLAKWHKKEGDAVSAGDVICEIETDKATMEVEAVDEGTLGKILIQEGTQDVAVNSVIALLLEDGEDKKALADYKPKVAEKKAEAKQEVAAENKENKQDAPKMMAAPAPAQIATPAVTQNFAPTKSAGGRIKASPLAKRIAAEKGVNLESVQGTGPNGRIVKADVENAPAGGMAQGVVRRNPNEVTAIPNNNMRKIIAKRLLESKQWVPHFYLSIDLNLDKLLDARKLLNEKGKDSYKISVNDMVIKAVAMALRDIPAANASWTDEAIMQYNNVDVSVAVAIDGGLVTPIIRNADQKTLVQISNEMKSLAVRARENKLQPEEFQGGGFSISNLGMYGIKNFSAIINPPQSCILAVGAGEERAIVQGGEIVKANMVSITLSCDHRVVDGAVGAEFLAAFKSYVEEPILMFI